MKKTLLLTGASGFVGQHCIKPLIDRGYDIHAVSSRECLSTNNVTWHQVNILDTPGITQLVSSVKASHLVHLAWYVAPGKWYNATENFDWMQASLELVKQFHLHGGRRVLMVGSGTEYDWSYGYCVSGKTPLSPNTFYGHCKRILCESLIEYASNAGLQASWARLFFLYGPGEAKSRLIASAINAMLEKQEAQFTHGNQVRDFMHVADAADALAFLLDTAHSGAINVASGQPITLKQLVHIAADQLSCRELLNFGALEAPPTDLPFVVADVEELTNLPWQQKFGHESGIRDTIDWWRKELKNKRSSNG